MVDLHYARRCDQQDVATLFILSPPWTAAVPCIDDLFNGIRSTSPADHIRVHITVSNVYRFLDEFHER